MFCTSCQRFLRELEAGVTAGEQEYASQDNLEDVTIDCYICFALHDSISDNFTGSGKVCFLRRIWILSPVNSHGFAAFRTIEFSMGYRLEADPEEEETWIGLIFRLERSNFENVASYKPPLHTSDPAVAQLVSSWLQICCQTHMDCSLNQDSAYKPPRLLQIGASGVRLVDGTQCLDGSGWVTLSHCWGRNPTFLRLTASNLPAFQDRILMKDLPQTFQDAIVLCERIGSRFLWIDSLCILQEGDGSKQDWLHHTNAMRSIYKNARLNISAEWGESSTSGLFTGRHPMRIDRPAVTFRAGPLEGHWTLTCSNAEFGPLSSNTPLRKRGWVVQERMLSPRVVRFCSDFVRWHCRDPLCHKSERYPDGIESPEGPRRFLQLPYPSAANMQPVLTNEAYRSFIDMAHMYSHTALTYPDLDKFPAFAGLAEHYSLLFKDQYIADFLKGHLPRALAWTRDKSAEQDEAAMMRPPTYRARSWSWASLDCRTFASLLIQSSVAADVQDVEDLCHITSHSLTPRDPLSPYGQLAHASLTMRAHLCGCAWDPEATEHVQVLGFDSARYAEVTFDTTADLRVVQDRTRVVMIGAHMSDLMVLGLLVEGVQRASTPTYKRIGQVRIVVEDLDVFFESLRLRPEEEVVLI